MWWFLNANVWPGLQARKIFLLNLTERQNRPLRSWKQSIAPLIRFVASVCRGGLWTVSHVFMLAGGIPCLHSESITSHCHCCTAAPLGGLKGLSRHKAMGVPTEASVFLLEMWNQLQGWITNWVGALYSLVPNSAVPYSIFSQMLGCRRDAEFSKWEVVLLACAINNATLGNQSSVGRLFCKA